jgi:hypothetical protein
MAPLDAMAAELARLPLDLIFAVNTRAALATKRTGTGLPVVFAQVSTTNSIAMGVRLARPGRNFTGLTTIKRMSKRLELLKETIAQLTQFDERDWRATFYTSGMEHSPTSATGTGRERTSWHATQQAAWGTLKKAEAS